MGKECPWHCRVDCGGCRAPEGHIYVQKRRKRCAEFLSDGTTARFGTCAGGCHHICHHFINEVFGVIDPFTTDTREKRHLRRQKRSYWWTLNAFSMWWHLPPVCIKSDGGRKRRDLESGGITYHCDSDVHCNPLSISINAGPQTNLRYRCIDHICQEVLTCVGAQWNADTKHCQLIGAKLPDHADVLEERIDIVGLGDHEGILRRKRQVCRRDQGNECSVEKDDFKDAEVVQKVKSGDCGFQGCCRYPGFSLKSTLLTGAPRSVAHIRECCAICKANKDCKSALFTPTPISSSSQGNFVCDKFVCPGNCQFSVCL